MRLYGIHTKPGGNLQAGGAGVLLGTLQLLLLRFGLVHLGGTTTLGLGLLLYVLISALVAYQETPRLSGTGAGVIIGAGAALVVLLPFIAYLLSASRPVPASALLSPGTISSYWFALLVLLLALLYTFLGILLAVLGGALGGFLGRRLLFARDEAEVQNKVSHPMSGTKPVQGRSLS
jgi:hypothetical protein